MSQQLSQQSEGGFSDIIPDVDKFIEENGISDDVGQLLRENDLKSSVHDNFDNEDKPTSEKLYANYSPRSYHSEEVIYPPEQPTDLCSDEYPGPLNFEVYIIPNEKKTPWEYSSKLHKIFILTNMKFPIAFSVTRPENLNLFVRATPVFSQAHFFQEIVQRCIAHQHPHDPSNIGLPAHIVHHIMRCSNESTRYFGNENEKSRLNIVLPLSAPQTGSDVVKEFFYFVCSNSCPSGMNRRPIEVIFTLENLDGEVLGRRVLSVRICKCPKRDKEKEESALENSNPPPFQGKKRKMNHSEELTADTRVFSLKDINIVGKNNRLLVLKYCRDLMAGEIVNMEGKNSSDAPFRKCFKEVNALISKASKD